MRPSTHTYGCAMLLSFGLFLIALPADGLSDRICDNIEAEWQSEEPRLTGAFPFYTLLGKQLGSLEDLCQFWHDFNPGLVQCPALVT